MDYNQFYKQFIDLLRSYCNLPGHTQTLVAAKIDMKLQAFNDILNSSKGINSKTQFELLNEMGVDHAQILKLLEAGVEKRKLEQEEAERRKRKNR